MQTFSQFLIHSSIPYPFLIHSLSIQILDLTKVGFVLAKPGGKFFLPTKPKLYKPRGRGRQSKTRELIVLFHYSCSNISTLSGTLLSTVLFSAAKPRKSVGIRRSPKKQPLHHEAPMDEGVDEVVQPPPPGVEVPDHDTEESSRDIIRKVIRLADRIWE